MKELNHDFNDLEAFNMQLRTPENNVVKKQYYVTYFNLSDSD